MYMATLVGSAAGKVYYSPFTREQHNYSLPLSRSETFDILELKHRPDHKKASKLYEKWKKKSSGVPYISEWRHDDPIFKDNGCRKKEASTWHSDDAWSRGRTANLPDEPDTLWDRTNRDGRNAKTEGEYDERLNISRNFNFYERAIAEPHYIGAKYVQSNGVAVDKPSSWKKFNPKTEGNGRYASGALNGASAMHPGGYDSMNTKGVFGGWRGNGNKGWRYMHTLFSYEPQRIGLDAANPWGFDCYSDHRSDHKDLYPLHSHCTALRDLIGQFVTHGSLDLTGWPCCTDFDAYMLTHHGYNMMAPDDECRTMVNAIETAPWESRDNYHCMPTDELFVHYDFFRQSRGFNYCPYGIHKMQAGLQHYQRCLVCSPYLGHESVRERLIFRGPRGHRFRREAKGPEPRNINEDVERSMDFNEKDEAYKAFRLSRGESPNIEGYGLPLVDSGWKSNKRDTKQTFNMKNQMTVDDIYSQQGRGAPLNYIMLDGERVIDDTELTRFNDSFHTIKRTAKPVGAKPTYLLQSNNYSLLFPAEDGTPIGEHRGRIKGDHYDHFPTFKRFVDSLSEHWIKTGMNPGSDRWDNEKIKDYFIDPSAVHPESKVDEVDLLLRSDNHPSSWFERGRVGKSPDELDRFDADSSHNSIISSNQPLPESNTVTKKSDLIVKDIRNMDDLLKLEWSDVTPMYKSASEGPAGEVGSPRPNLYIQRDPRVEYYYYRVCPKNQDNQTGERAHKDNAEDANNLCLMGPEGLAFGGEVRVVKMFNGVPIDSPGLGYTSADRGTYTEGSQWHAWHLYLPIDLLEESQLRLDQRMNSLHAENVDEERSLETFYRGVSDSKSHLLDGIENNNESMRQSNQAMNIAVEGLRKVSEMPSVEQKQFDPVITDEDYEPINSHYEENKAHQASDWNEQIGKVKAAFHSDVNEFSDAARKQIELIRRAYDKQQRVIKRMESAGYDITNKTIRQWIQMLQENDSHRKLLHQHYIGKQNDAMHGHLSDVMKEARIEIEHRTQMQDDRMHTIAAEAAEIDLHRRDPNFEDAVKRDQELHQRRGDQILSKMKEHYDELLEHSTRDFNERRKLRNKFQDNLYIAFLETVLKE